MVDYPIVNWFMYHAPTPEQVEKYQVLRDKAKELAYLIVDLVPEGPISGPDKTSALRLLRQAIMTANAGIACG